MTREELLASVHVLQPGDLLFVRLTGGPLLPEKAENIQRLIRAKVPAGVEVLVGDEHVSLEQYRKVEP